MHGQGETALENKQSQQMYIQERVTDTKNLRERSSRLYTLHNCLSGALVDQTVSDVVPLDAIYIHVRHPYKRPRLPTYRSVEISADGHLPFRGRVRGRSGGW